MILDLLLAAGVLFLLSGGYRLFSRRNRERMFGRGNGANVKSVLVGLAIPLGLSMAATLLLSGRGVVLLAALPLIGPIAWEWWRGRRPAAGAPAAPTGRMTAAEALAVLGLRPGAQEVEIRAAYHRLMLSCHPDRGGSDWMAARLNEARDTLLRR